MTYSSAGAVMPYTTPLSVTPPRALMASMADRGKACSALNRVLVWNLPALATIKSLAVKLDTYLSISKPPAKFTVTVSSTTARDSESTVTAVLPLLRPRLAQAMVKGFTFLVFRPLARVFPPPSA